MTHSRSPLTRWQRIEKRSFDLMVAVGALGCLWPFLVVAWVVCAIDTRASGFFRQVRIGRNGDPFDVLKLRTMADRPGTSVTTTADSRITRSGAVLRALKVDELPQLWNVIRGEMSLVGPRPDVPGFADTLTGPDRVILSVRPGITGPASLTFRHEERLLVGVEDPESYNREVIWPAKVRVNREYVANWSFKGDLAYLWLTLASSGVGNKPEDS